MEADETNLFFPAQPPPPPRRVSLPPFPTSASPSPRRLSSHFVQPSWPLRPPKQLAWVSLQGRLVGAEDASSARAIRGGLGPQQAVAWDLFTPIQRVLVVAVIAVASANSEKNKRIYRLTKSVELRDQILLSMQQKLDNLCEQLNSIKDQPGTWADMLIDKNVDFAFKEPIAVPKLRNLGCGCQLCDHHKLQSNGSLVDSLLKNQRGDEVPKYKHSLSNAAEAEERRMSDMSDWNSSVASSVDLQMNSFVIEQDVENLKKEREEKDATIKELSTFLHSSQISSSKRIAELEDIIRTKNMRITRLRKDMLVLEQKVVHLTRLRRSSNSNMKRIPAMADNVLYDMESTTGPSSSDSESPSRNHPQSSVPKTQNNSVSKNSSSKSMQEAEGLKLLTKQIARKQQKAGPISPMKEKSLYLKTEMSSSRRRVQSGTKLAATQKRWV